MLGPIPNVDNRTTRNDMNSAESILNALAEPVLLLDDDLRVVAANAAFYETMMISPEHSRGKTVQDVIAEGGEAINLKTVLESVATRNSDVEHLEIECAVAEAERKILSLTARRVAFGDDAPEMVLVELQDITRQEEAEGRILALNTALQQHAAELEVINQDLESFTYSVSHDLRAPLRLTNKIAHLLLHEHGSELTTGAANKIHMILESTREMGKLIEDLLAFSQVRHAPVKMRPVGVRRLAHEALEELQDEQEGRDVSVTIDNLPSCQGDRSLLKQVFLNLLGNALKFTRTCEKAEIEVGFRIVDGKTVYFVRDNGVGFDEKHANAIFLPFHRLHRNKGFEGSGLGLALVKRVVESHGGRIWPESRPGHGTTMFFTLHEQIAVAPANTDRNKTP